MYEVTITSITGLEITTVAESEAEMLDAVRFSMQSESIVSVNVEKANPDDGESLGWTGL